MNNDNESGNMPSGKPAIDSTGRTDATAASAHETADGININFRSAEFNHIDDLNDYSGNCRNFQSLDGVVTADMLHQLERQGAVNAVDTLPAAPRVPAGDERGTNEAEEFKDLPPLTLISRGRILIVDTDVQRALTCGQHLSNEGLTCTLAVTGKASPSSVLPMRGGFSLLETPGVSVTGTFGNFSATALVKEEQKPLTEWLDDAAAAFDLVLDLQSSPSFAGNRLPLGYYAPGSNPVKLNEVMTELPQMRGRFHKPQFMVFLENHCLHGLSHKSDCSQCLTVCPFGAIQSIDRKISFNHYLCQGCSGCTLVCPADAIHMVQPPQGNLLNSLRRTLEDRPAGITAAPTLVISDVDTAGGCTLSWIDEINGGRGINFAVEQIGYVGLDMLLVSLAYGAGSVVVACEPQNAPTIISAVRWQVQMGRAILLGLGLPEDRIRFAFIPHESDQPGKENFVKTCCETRPDIPILSPAEFSFHNDKRTLVRLAAQHLFDQSGVREPALPLPAGSPFGAVEIDAAACTLCMACATACPSGALIAGGDAPKLEFIESRCHQCYLCEEACPESAVRLSPRILCDLKKVETPALLHGAQPARCIECGIPFASPAMISRMQNKLAGHWMYANERQLRRLQMCRTCRTRDALMSPDLKSWNQVQL